MRARRSMRGRAAEAGIGAVRRVHRQRRGWPNAVQIAPGAPLVAVAVGLVFVFDWRAAFLVPVLAWAGIACWVLLGPLPEPGGPRRSFAVCDGGILVASQATAVAIPWDALARPVLDAKGAVLRLVWTKGDEERHIRVGPVSAPRDLGRAVRKQGPVRPRAAPRLAVAATGAAVLALVGWIAQPWLVRTVLGERPEHLKDLARLCSRQDRPYERAAAYSGSGSHPLVFFREDPARPALVTAGGGRARPAPDEVQLVACGSPAGRVSGTPIQVCRYEGGFRLGTYQGRHSLDVFEARTGRRVGRQVLTGTDSVGACPGFQLVWGSREQYPLSEVDTSPTQAQYDAALRAYATGPRRS
ncbi:hypothetical protein [Actinomadura madurae]|uniref:PH domain-containing protein n=1 Tax=Actinomadura madurae TaxID=1993 RepID=A0A1I4X704_9ACTN|nr:hypothetical protein [Actinomadura madurae]SFN21751.1 hypothetical protein SAMN04489713_101730 [Actinomadura madurae]SPT63348.1 Uncharacterised protein [Actinomadura madurae]